MHSFYTHSNISLWANLPYEILLSIFLQLDSLRDVAQCQLVCSKWRSPAQERFYKSITLPIPTRNKVSTAEKLIAQLTLAPLGQFVKILDIKTLFYEELKITGKKGSIFTRLIKLCPNLETLSAQQDLLSPFYQTLQQNRAHLPYLQKIPEPIYDKDLEHYVNTVLVFQKTLKYLYLSDRVPSTLPTTIHAKEFDRLARNLKEFPCLQQLKIEVRTDKNVFELEDLINDCHALNTLWITIYQPPIANYYAIDNLSTVIKHPHIRKIVGDNVVLTNTSINYMMHKFPQLKSLIIKRFNERYYDVGIQQSFELSVAVATRLFQYISTMRYFELLFSISEDRIPAVLDSFINSTTNNDFFLTIEYSNDMNIFNYPSMDIHKASGHDRYSMCPFNFDPKTNIVGINYLLDHNESNLPHKQIINQFGNNLKSLQLSARAAQDFHTHDYGGSNSNKESNFHTAITHSINHILSHCCSLKSLSFYDMYLLNNQTNFIPVNRSIEKLEIGVSAILPKSLEQISWCLPSLRHLTLSACEFVDFRDSGDERKPYTDNLIFINMPNTSFENITWKRQFEQKRYQYKVLICVVDESASRYFVGDQYQLHASTCEEFHRKDEAEIHHAHLRFNIRCKSIHAFTIELHNFCKKYSISSVL